MGPLKALYKDPEVTEIMVDGPHLVRIEKRGEVLDTKVRFKSTRDLERLVFTLHGLKDDAEGVARESRLADGSRITSVTGEAAIGGPFLLIRKIRSQPPTWEMLQEWKFMSKEGAALLSGIIASGQSVLASGSAASGLTTLVNIYSSQINPICRVIGIEDKWTLQIQHPHAIVLSANKEKRGWVTTARNLLADAIVIGELDGSEAFELIRATQEKTQVIAALRANSVADALRRMELYCLQANVAWSAADHRSQISQSFRIVTFQEQLPGSKRRLIREIAEVDGLDNGSYKLEPLLRWNEKSDQFELTPRAQRWLK
jgi:pilus assembly protein CpaF